jgi:hypothetical protein
MLKFCKTIGQIIILTYDELTGTLKVIAEIAMSINVLIIMLLELDGH